ncbi:retrovirus-related pol polyprotein from transposon TNT 1-94, partial [Tanacetum coccineum]
LENPEQVFHSRRKLFVTTSFEAVSSPEFSPPGNIAEEPVVEQTEEELTDEEIVAAMAKMIGSDLEDANEHIEKVLEIVDLFHVPNITQDQIMLRVFPMSLTGAASGWLRNQPSGSIKTWVDLKTKFLNKYCPPARTAKKIEEINNFQQETDETLFQYLTNMQEVILFNNWLDIPTRQILDSKGVVPSMTAPDAKKAIQEMAEYSQKWHNGTSRSRSTETSNRMAAIQAQLNNLDEKLKRATGPGFYQRNNANSSYTKRRQSLEESLAKFMAESTKRHEENSAIIKVIRASSDTAIRNLGASIKILELQIGQMSKVLQERGFENFSGSTETNPQYHVKAIATARSDWNGIRHIASYEYAVFPLPHPQLTTIS